MTPTVGATLFSFTEEWRTASLDLRGLRPVTFLRPSSPDVSPGPRLARVARRFATCRAPIPVR